MKEFPQKVMTKRPYNFGAGPAMLPEPILLQAQEAVLDWQGLGVSILEIGHRTKEFIALLEQAESDLRELMSIPDNYRVLFLGGAARTHFGMVPMNFLTTDKKAGYLVTGLWSLMAYKEATKLKNAYCVVNNEESGFHKIPDSDQWKIEDNTTYVYYTPNETIDGIRFTDIPQIGDIPLIADMTSCILSEPFNVSNFALIFAGAQKNIASAGLTVVIVQDEWLAQATDNPLPSMLDYRAHVANKSLLATPPTFNCYVAAKMFQWVKKQGGVNALYQINCQKAAKLYEYIDNSSFYSCNVEKSVRSIMNVCFSLANPKLEEAFLSGAAQRGLYALKGHWLVGGLRASLYNAMPIEGVEALIAFMHDFSKEHA